MTSSDRNPSTETRRSVRRPAADTKRPVKAWILLVLLELGLAAVLTVTIILVLGNQVDRSRHASDLADAALGAMANADQCREAQSWELKKYYGIAEEDVEEFALRLPVSNMDAAELCVVKCATDEGAQTVAAAMKKRLDSQISLFENYGVEQMKLLRAARVVTAGPYAAIIIDEKASDAEAALKKAVKR